MEVPAKADKKSDKSDLCKGEKSELRKLHIKMRCRVYRFWEVKLGL